MFRGAGILSLFFVVWLSSIADAVEIDVGARQVSVTIPDGYAELTPKMSPYYETMRAYIAPTNSRHMTLIRQDKADALLRGESVELERYMNVESEKGLDGESVSAARYDEFRDVLRTQLDEIVEEVNQRLPGIIDKGNADVSEAFDMDIAVSVGNMVPLPIHMDSAHSMAYSMYLNIGTAIDGENTSTGIIAATMLALHVKDKVIFLYVYGAEPDLEWTREFAADWAERIIARNPISDELKGAIERPRTNGIRWDKVLGKALIGAFIGGIIGFFGFLFGRRKKE